ncbi:hypothetical protein [Aeromonas phage AS-yj]|uniref:Uncharacterized protein n=3 Tax=Ceceduovirus TaxID=2842588 RepID=A0A223LEG4_9CAUD|nr:hypothetical protein HWB28_gp154 [Aeromonas phage AS-zj]YP_009835091.1 hypothetical protein HWB29_gp389 [Aeromonas phage AS-sw]ASU00398.1 hypothetical protein [Aeromonas phage AS-zj]ATI17909.1 hypothetical protein [Aeromonas phage AS-yj]ATI18439.1 hypothetical protein [Aeromonas phage AS-sw]
MITFEEQKSRISDMVGLCENTVQLITILENTCNILKKNLSGVKVVYVSGGGWASSYVKMVGEKQFQLPDEFYVKNDDGQKFKVTTEVTTFGGGHGEGPVYAARNTEIRSVNGNNWDFRDRELTIITKEEALS